MPLNLVKKQKKKVEDLVTRRKIWTIAFEITVLYFPPIPELSI